MDKEQSGRLAVLLWRLRNWTRGMDYGMLSRKKAVLLLSEMDRLSERVRVLEEALLLAEITEGRDEG